MKATLLPVHLSHARVHVSRLITPLAVIIGGIAVYRLVSSILSAQYAPLFWDCGSLILGIMNDGFPLGREVVAGDYATLKYGYALPYWIFYRAIGLNATLVLNSLWYLVVLLIPIRSVLFRSQGKVAWTGYFCYLAGILALPFVNKYIEMANPTIQSIALWMLLGLYYGNSRDRSRRVSRLMLVPGLLCGLLVLTDYKWLLLCIVGITAVETVEGLLARDTWKQIPTRVGLVAVWICAVIGVVSIFNQTYLMSVFQYVTGPGRIDAFRFGFSWNLVIFLWVLGGIWLALWLFWRLAANRLMVLRGRDEVTATVRRIMILAAVITIGFSIVLWPRSARMFAPVVVLGLLLVGWQAQVAIDAWRERKRRAWIPVAALAVALATLIPHALDAGKSFRLPNGVRAMSEFVNAHRETIGTEPIGCYMPTIFNVLLESPLECSFLPSKVRPTMDWVIGSKFVDRMIVEDQTLFGLKEPIWRSSSLAVNAAIEERAPLYAAFANDFYFTPNFICESNYTNSALVDLLQEASGITELTWDLRYIGEMLGRERPRGMTALPAKNR